MAAQTIAQCTQCDKKHDAANVDGPLYKCPDCGGLCQVYTCRQMTPEELAKYGPAIPSRKKPAAQIATWTEQRRRANKRYEELNGMKKQEKQGPSNGLTKREYIVARASGETIASIEKAWGMKVNTLQNWIKKWDLRGLTAEKAQELLEKGSVPDEKPEGIVTKPGISGVSTVTDPRDAQIVKLKGEVVSATTANDHLHNTLTSLESQLDSVKLENEDLEAKIDDFTSGILDRDREISQLKQAINELNDERSHLLATIEKAAKTPAEAPRISLDGYQFLASRTANTDWELILVRLIRDPKLLPLLNFSLGAAGEAGELADEVKKIIFHGHKMDDAKLIKEIGDCLWYLSQLARVVGYRFEFVAEKNIEKLQERYPEGFSEEQSQNREVDHESA